MVASIGYDGMVGISYINAWAERIIDLWEYPSQPIYDECSKEIARMYFVESMLIYNNGLAVAAEPTYWVTISAGRGIKGK